MTNGQQKSARQNLDRGCWIRLAPDRIVDALLLEVSHSGAKLALQQTADVPAQFDLLLTRDGKVGRKAAVTRKSDNELEVRFLSRTIPHCAGTEPDDDADDHVVVKV